MKIFSTKRGFTLIELLVVIAIIGLLASIVMINLNSARNRAKAAAIKGALSELRNAAELDYDITNPPTYENVCNDTANDINNVLNTDFERIRQSIITQSSTATRVCYDSASAWCAQVTNLPGGGGWCVDSTGVSTATVNCDGTSYNCP